MHRYKVIAPFRFIMLASLVGPFIGLVLVAIRLDAAYVFTIQPPTNGLNMVADLAAGFENMMTRFAPIATLLLGVVPAAISGGVIATIARWRPITSLEAVILTAVVSLGAMFVLGPSYLHDTLWIILVPVLPAAIVTWLVARRARLIARSA